MLAVNNYWTKVLTVMGRTKGPAKKVVGVRLLESPTLKNISDEAKRNGLTVSAFLALAIENKFGRKK